MSKIAILQVADTGPLESLVVMLRSVGYDCYVPSDSLKRELRSLGCDTVLDIADLVRSWGYDQPLSLPEAGMREMESADLYCDVKAHRNGPLVWSRWPNLRGRTVWYRINGGKPEHVIRADGYDCGDEADPPCPVITPNLWYREAGPWTGKSYAVWPPFYRFGEYYPIHGRVNGDGSKYDSPICLIHNLQGWGYGALVDEVRSMGVKMHGVRSPDGLISHREMPAMLSRARCMVHLKSSDAPGYALYEALAAACPVVCTRRLIWRNRMQELFIPGETCLVFDRETHEGLSPEDVASCSREIRGHLETLRDPDINRRIGMAGREKLRQLMWHEDEDKQSLRDFLHKVLR